MICEIGKKYDIAEIISRWIGWTDNSSIEGYMDSSSIEGYNVDYYFDAEGRYRGPDEYGIEPVFSE